jgi:hypothetical protein
MNHILINVGYKCKPFAKKIFLGIFINFLLTPTNSRASMNLMSTTTHQQHTNNTPFGSYSEADIKSIASVAHNMTHQQKLALIDEIIQITQSRMTATEDDAEWEHVMTAELAIQMCREVDERVQAKVDAFENGKG